MQKFEGEDYFLITVFLNNLGLIKTYINVTTKEVKSFECKSFLDMFNILKKKKED